MCPAPAGVPTSLQQAADGAGVLRQEHGSRHRKQQLSGLYAVLRHHAVAGHRALPAHRHLSAGWAADQRSRAPGELPPPRPPHVYPTHLGAQLQPHAPAPAQEAGHWVRVAAAHRPHHLRQPSAVGKVPPWGGEDGAHARRKGSGWGRGPESRDGPAGRREWEEPPARDRLQAGQRDVQWAGSRACHPQLTLWRFA